MKRFNFFVGEIEHEGDLQDEYGRIAQVGGKIVKVLNVDFDEESAELLIETEFSRSEFTEKYETCEF